LWQLIEKGTSAMLKKIIFSLSLMFYSLLSFADQITLNENAPTTYIVVKGDTLWDISAIFLEQPWLWPKLWRLNPEINNPHLIYPGDVLTLVYDENGQPMLVKGEINSDKITKPTYKWSPAIRQQQKQDNAITLLPLEIIAPYLKYEHLFTEEQLDALPHVLGSDEGHRMTTNNFKVYVNDNLDLAKSYAIYNRGEEILDPETGDSLGFLVDLVAIGQVLQGGDIDNDVPSTMRIGSVKREILAGDYVVPVNEGQLLPAVFVMKPGKEAMRGAIVQASSKGREFAKMEVIMINRGIEHEVTAGDVMAIKRTSPAVVETSNGPAYINDTSRWNQIVGTDYKMPEESVGTLMVFKVYQQASLALILSTEKPARINDVITAPNK
jgi:hypothetical protein